VAALAPAHQHRRPPWHVVLWARPGRKVTYTNPHRWLPGLRPADGDTALRTLVSRCLHAYGPATPQHFAKWLSIPPRYATELFGNLAGDLEYAELDGQPGWTLAGDTKTPAGRTAGSSYFPTSTPTSSRASPATCCIPARPPPARSLRLAKRETTQSCSSTA
jgi:hypothetical protein